MDVIVDGFLNLMEVSEFQTLFKLVLIAILAGIIGYERESWKKPAGFRTYILVAISSVLVMECGNRLYSDIGADPTRIPAQLLSGIGFLGAGTILRDGFNVKGLTTAAALLAVTCVGLIVGAGYYLSAILATFVIYCVLSYSHVLSDKLERFNFLDLEITILSSSQTNLTLSFVFKFNVFNIVLGILIPKEFPHFCSLASIIHLHPVIVYTKFIHLSTNKKSK